MSGNTGSRRRGCIYCGEHGPCSDEHVIPAGLGAGDAWQLRGLVCRDCNALFSEFEGRVLRRGDIGLGRLAMQLRGRDRGGKTRPPRFEAVASKLIRDDGHAVEVALGHQLAPEILPYVCPRGETLEGGGSDRAKVGRFLDKVQLILHGQVSLLRKRSSPSAAHTRIDLSLGPQGYAVHGMSTVDKPDEMLIWLEAHQHDFPGQEPTLLMRPQGGLSVVVTEGDVDAAAALLTMVKAHLGSLRQQFEATSNWTEIPQPGIRVRAEAPPEIDVARLLVKTGFNLLVHAMGDAPCRDPRFDSLCQFVRTGTPDVRMTLWPEEESLAPLLRAQFPDQHWMLLAPMPNPNDLAGPMGMAFACSLYGAPARLVLLSADVPTELRFAHRIVAVDYTAQQVRGYSLVEFRALVANTVAAARAVAPGPTASG